MTPVDNAAMAEILALFAMVFFGGLTGQVLMLWNRPQRWSDLKTRWEYLGVLITMFSLGTFVGLMAG